MSTDIWIIIVIAFLLAGVLIGMLINRDVEIAPEAALSAPVKRRKVTCVQVCAFFNSDNPHVVFYRRTDGGKWGRNEKTYALKTLSATSQFRLNYALSKHKGSPGITNRHIIYTYLI